MFGFIFALIIAGIILVAVSYVAIKLYFAVQTLSEENEELKLDYQRASNAHIEASTLAEDFRGKYRAKCFEVMDMEKALNLALEETMTGQVEIKPVQEFKKLRHPVQPTFLGGPRMGKTALQEKIVERLSTDNPHALIVMNNGPVLRAKDVYLENLKTGERRELASAAVEFSASDDIDFDPDFWKRMNPPQPIVDTMTLDAVNGESLKRFSEKIPGVESMPEWEKTLRQNPDSYTQLSGVDWDGETKLNIPSEEKVNRILDATFGPKPTPEEKD